jgi:hypothetical protein
MYSLIYNNNNKILGAILEHDANANIETIRTLFQTDTLQKCIDEMGRVGVAIPEDIRPYLSTDLDIEVMVAAFG